MSHKDLTVYPLMNHRWTFLATDTIGEMAFGESFNTLVDEKVNNVSVNGLSRS